jgi:hypothetical protein
MPGAGIVRRKIERRNDPAEDVQRSSAAAPTRTTTRATANHPPRSFGHDAVKAGRESLPYA